MLRSKDKILTKKLVDPAEPTSQRGPVTTGTVTTGSGRNYL